MYYHLATENDQAELSKEVIELRQEIEELEYVSIVI